GKSGAVGGKDEMYLPLVGKADKLRLYLCHVVRQEQRLDHFVSRFFKLFHDDRAAFIFPLPGSSLITQGDDRRRERARRVLRQKGDRVSHPDVAGLSHLGKDALPWHDAVAHHLIDLTMAVTFLADLCHLKLRLPDTETAAHRQAGKVEALHDQVLPEGSKG